MTCRTWSFLALVASPIETIRVGTPTHLRLLFLVDRNGSITGVGLVSDPVPFESALEAFAAMASDASKTIQDRRCLLRGTVHRDATSRRDWHRLGSRPPPESAEHPAHGADRRRGRQERLADSRACRKGGRPTFTRSKTWVRCCAAESLDAVFICLPPPPPRRDRNRCAEHGAQCVIEKPVSCDLDSARRAAEAVAKANTVGQRGVHESLPRFGRAGEGDSRPRQRPAGIGERFWVGEMPPPHWWRTMSQVGRTVSSNSVRTWSTSRAISWERLPEVSAYATRGSSTM